MSSVLTKTKGKKQHSIYYIRKVLLDAETKYTNLEKLIFQCHMVEVETTYSLHSIPHKLDLVGRMATLAVDVKTTTLSTFLEQQ